MRIDATRFTDELARRLPDADQFDIAKARETAGATIHDAAGRGPRVLRPGGRAGRGSSAAMSPMPATRSTPGGPNPLDAAGQRLRAVASTAAVRALIARLERELPDTDRDRYARAFARGRAQGRSKYLAVGIAAGVTTGDRGCTAVRAPARR